MEREVELSGLEEFSKRKVSYIALIFQKASLENYR